MNNAPWILVAVIVAVAIVLIGIAAVPAYRIKQKEFKKTGKYPKGHYLGLGMAIGIALGMPFGAALDIPSLGISFGLPIGLAIGLAWEKKNADKLRPLTKKEEELKKKMLWILVATMALGIAAFAYLALRVRQG